MSDDDDGGGLQTTVAGACYASVGYKLMATHGQIGVAGHVQPSRGTNAADDAVVQDVFDSGPRMTIQQLLESATGFPACEEPGE